jgi:TolA-binding protein
MYLVAVESYNIENYLMASNMLKNYLKTYPEGKYVATANKMRLWSLFLIGNYSDCILLAENGDSEDSLYISGMSYYQSGDIEKAKKFFSLYMDKYPNGRYLKQCQIPLVRISFDESVKSGDKKKMIGFAARLHKISGSPSDAIRLAWAYEQDHSYDEASKIYYSVAASSPNTRDASEALFRKAMIDIISERYSAAEVALAESAKIVSENAKNEMPSRKDEINYWRGVCAVRTSHEEKALEFLSSAVKGNLSLDQSLEARILIADIKYNSGHYAESKKMYGEIVSQSGTKRMSAEKIFQVAKFLMEEKFSPADLKNAMLSASNLEKFYSADEWKQRAQFIIGMIEDRRGNYAAAEKAYSLGFSFAKKTELSKDAAYAFGVLLRKNGKFDLADKYLSYAIELNSENPSLRAKAYLELAENSLLKHDTKKAKAYATVVVTLFNEPELSSRAQEILRMQ